MGIIISQVDAFASEPFKGNPAAVCVLGEVREEAWMQQVAMEMNLSETAFLLKEGTAYRLRWFTPENEIDLCGHATLASAHVLWELGYLSRSETAVFATKSGELRATWKAGLIELDFPVRPAVATPPPEGLLEILGIQAVEYTGRAGGNYLVQVADEQSVCELEPDFSSLNKLPLHGVIVTSRAILGSKYDFISRFFAPEVGVNEDPVTGSAHCTLAPFWRELLGKQEFLAYQASRRGGELRVRLEGERVKLAGQAVTVMRGEFYG